MIPQAFMGGNLFDFGQNKRETILLFHEYSS